MLLIDFSHLASRNLFTSVFNARPKKKDGKYITEDFIRMYLHQMFVSLNFLKKQFKRNEIVLAIDSRMNWRKDFYPDYKGHRKKNRDESEINFEEFFKYNKELIQELKDSFSFKVVEVDRAEADDVIFTLAEKFSKYSDLVVVTEDKDMKIVLKYGAKMYMPIKKKFVDMTSDELSLWVKIHICLGDSSDNVPNILYNTQFSPEYKKYLKEKGLEISEYQYDCLSFDDVIDLEDKFDIWYKNKKGENVEKMIFKKVRFGEKTAEKFAKVLETNLAGEDEYHQLLKRNFVRNKTLIHPSGIPQDIKDKIFEEYNKSSITCNYKRIMKYFLKYSLREQVANIGSFTR
jgi:5'-3' exonuclease